MFESRSTPRGGIFWAPLPPSPLPPRGPGFPQGSMLPQGTGGPHVSYLPALRFQGTRLSGARASALLSCFQEARHPPCFHAFRRPCFHAFRRLPGGRLPDFQASSMLSGAHAFRRFSGGHTSPGIPGARASLNFFFFVASAPFVFAS